MNYEAIKQAAEGYKADMAKFLRDMIAIPSESCEEEGVVKRIAEELTKLGYDKVEFDKLGNVIGWVGPGDNSIALASTLPSTLTSTPSASATATTGKPTPIRVMRPTISSTAAAVPIRKAAWQPQLTAARS